MANFLTVEEYFKKLGFVDGGEVLVRRAKFTPAEELLPKDGRDGKDGLEGPQGPSGKDGSDGKDGRDGRDGVDGKDGVGLNWRGEYNPSEDYTPNDAVYYLGSSYVCVKDTRNNPPNQSKTYWNLLASAGAGGSNGRDFGEIDVAPVFNQLGLGGVFIGPTEPETDLKQYIWVQTGLGSDGQGHTMWFRTCEEA